MFKENIKELYKYLTKEELDKRYNCIIQKRKSTLLYDFVEYKWVLAPLETDLIKEEDVEASIENVDTLVLFIDKKDIKEYDPSMDCRPLIKDDLKLFNDFHESCSEEDKEEGMVSLDDPVVYGCFVDGIIVSVSSLWNWGEKLSDIGILTHPDYRHKGYGKNVCLRLMNEVDKMYVWRCDESNKGSYNLAISIGFRETGKIFELNKETMK